MNAALAKLKTQSQQLNHWLIHYAYPLWANQGVDRRNGGFVELLDQQGHPLNKPRRARVQPRQIYSFAMAQQFHWQGDAQSIVKSGIQYFVEHYQREDGLFRTLCDTEGRTLDDRAFLYDQSFALLAFATAAKALDAVSEMESQALILRDAIQQQLRTKEKGFISSDFHSEIRESNPHMHLLEACLAWNRIGKDIGWSTLVEELADLALSKFIQPNGALKEFFTDDWQPAPGIPGRVVEPGHQFEWAWLLLQCDASDVQRRRDAALKLIDIGERYGVRNGVAINTLLDDFSIHDANARLWCQTERIKAGVLAGQISGEEKYFEMASSAVGGLLHYFDTPVKGLWLDIQQTDGTLVNAPSPASSFYHIIAAIAQLSDGVKAFQ
ncbi:MAG TPA: AGE family epimerase/isomerase [Steroidobacteraceae bacterium]|nr:AGE family epimerase/isomerase [Steroidobacteraceae bacterium]